ncbi:MAG: electron transport complex subunit E [Clostridia bacterium]|nr:electron transport complex subunit E [Clostridia bacterium]
MKNSKLKEFTKGIIRQNPVLVLVLGTCPTLAVTTSAMNAIGMGVAATVVLLCSNIVISLLRKFIPDAVRIPAYITVIAGFVTVVQMIVKAYTPALDKSLGIYLPLIVVNCIILGRAEAFASKNTVVSSALDGLGMGIGFTAAMLCMGIIRELLGSGTVFGLTVLPDSFFTPILIFILPAGGFFVFGLLIALANKIIEKQGKKPVANGCEACPMKDKCAGEGKEGADNA